MSYCKEDGKDRIIFVSEDDHNKPSTIELPDDDEPVGLIKENGDVNWHCPCLGGMATGPCGVEFRDAFTCFHYSDNDPKGADCIDTFKTMSSCMATFPGVYGNNEDNPMAVNEEDDEDQRGANNSSANASSSNSTLSKSNDDTSPEDQVSVNDSTSKEISKS